LTVAGSSPRRTSDRRLRARCHSQRSVDALLRDDWTHELAVTSVSPINKTVNREAANTVCEPVDCEVLPRLADQSDFGWIAIAALFALVSAASGRGGIIAAAASGGALAIASSAIAFLEMNGTRISYEAVWTVAATVVLAAIGSAAQSGSANDAAPSASTPTSLAAA